jgi:hypothetical protein
VKVLTTGNQLRMARTKKKGIVFIIAFQIRHEPFEIAPQNLSNNLSPSVAITPTGHVGKPLQIRSESFPLKTRPARPPKRTGENINPNPTPLSLVPRG